MKRNPSQQRAIAHLSGPMMVLAGPGSGKTSVIVERTAHMIHEGKIPASSVLVVTFSRAAAVEMKERFLKFTGVPRTGVTFGTFHGVFYGILKQAYGLNGSNILSEEEKYAILRELVVNCAAEQAQEGDFVEDIAKEIGVVKGGRIALEHYYSSCCPDEVFRQIFKGYRKVLNERRKLDFDDMLLSCYELLRKRKDILAAWQKKFQYILVDEFQDINSLQYKILQMLAAPANNLFIVGDDDQSIYHFRGAKPEIMLNFTKDYPKAETVLLDINYRCTKNVLQAAMNVVGCNQIRFKKRLSTPNEQGKPVKVMEFDNPREEYVKIAAFLKKRLEAGENLEDTAVLFRTNQEAEGLVGALMEYQIPFTMKEQLANIRTQALEAFEQARDSAALDALRVQYLGKKGELTAVLKQMGKLSAEERPVMGQLANDVRAEIEKKIEEITQEKKAREQAEKLDAEKLDVTIPGDKIRAGHTHPLALVQRQLEDIFLGMGYSIVDGPEVEYDYYNFQALNIPKDHPARDTQDTFYITENILLRSQTSPVQARVMEKTQPPIKIISPGRVYRSDAVDATHSPLFHQLEGLVVDKGITMGDLKGALEMFARRMYGEETQIRFRPHHFPFTEPSAEVDVSCFACGGKGCRLCKGEGWIEILGAGMVHPNVLRMCGIDPEVYSGFAFGVGIERIALLKYHIDDMRLLYENDVRFLSQF